MKTYCSFCRTCLTDKKGQTKIAILINDIDSSKTIITCERCAHLALNMFRGIIEGMLGKKESETQNENPKRD